MIRLQLPDDSKRAERLYVADVIFDEFLGLNFDVEFSDKLAGPVIHLGEGRTLELADGFFGLPDDDWLRESTLPLAPLATWQDTDLPILYGTDELRDGYLGLDVFGSAFFMLSRYEEAAVEGGRDSRDRFQSVQSVAHREGFLGRPIINEYVEILVDALRRMDSDLSVKKHEFRVVVSHDVDCPFKYKYYSFPQIVRSCGGDLIKRRSPSNAVRNFSLWCRARLIGDLSKDPANNFDMIMDLNENAGLRGTFFFISDHTAGAIDGHYGIDDPEIRSLLRSIHERGHKIGLHPSFNTYLDAPQLGRELARLRKACDDEGIQQDGWGARMHNLRWRTPDTMRHLDGIGVSYDTTLGYADRPGFRCGTCYEFPTYDVVERRPLKIRERPLTAMDVSLLEPRYLGLDIDGAASLLQSLKEQCRRFGGDFVLLWHNDRFSRPEEVELYRSLL